MAGLRSSLADDREDEREAINNYKSRIKQAKLVKAHKVHRTIRPILRDERRHLKKLSSLGRSVKG